jgi:hypothetical protein
MQNALKETRVVRLPRRDRGQPLWTSRDLIVLGWIADQYGMRRDHLAMLLARESQGATKTPGRLAATTVKDWVQRWRQAGIVESARLLVGQPGWVWLTRAGLEQVERDYRYWEPKARGLDHLHAVNQVRLWLEARSPSAQWLSERQLRHGRPFTPKQTRAEHQPDAEVTLDAQRIAIEVELTAKTPQEVQAILYGLVRAYTGIWYFCPPPTKGLMQRALAQLSEPTRRKFSVIELP